jgi:hypothetical protein
MLIEYHREKRFSNTNSGAIIEFTDEKIISE